jgi:hypothetical protein
MTDGDDCGAISGVNDWEGKPKSSEKTCSSAALPITEPTWLDPGSNLGRSRKKPANNRLIYGMTCFLLLCYDSACVWNVVSDIKGRTKTHGV